MCKSDIMANSNCFVALLAIVVCLEPVLTTDCPDTWVAYKGSCYLFGNKMPSTFVEAEHYCRQHDAHLVHIDDATENAFLRAYLHRLTAEFFWNGLTDETVEGVWEWYDTHTQATYTDWSPGEPNGHYNQNCVMFHYALDFHWVDVICNESHEPLCELRRDHTEIVG